MNTGCRKNKNELSSSFNSNIESANKEILNSSNEAKKLHPELKRWHILGFLAASVSLIVIDGTIVNVALPQMVASLKLTFTDAQWITTIYALIFSALLITFGRVADLWGRRNMLLSGILIFTLGSLWAALATSGGTLLTARALQGLGAAAVLPTTLSTINAIFQDKQRAIAFAVWGSVISGMAALGPLAGGFLVTHLSWPWIFYINLPLGAIITIGVIVYVPNSKGAKLGKGIDMDGFLLSTLSFGGLVFALIEGRTKGWWFASDGSSHLSIAAWAWIIGLVSLLLFIFWELHRIHNGREKLLDLRLFKIRSFALGNIAAGTIAIGEFGLLFVLPLFLQNCLGLSALQSGAILAAMASGAFVAGGFAAPYAKRTSPAQVALTGLTLEVTALIGLGLAGVATTRPVLATTLWLLLYGFGLGLASAQLTSTILVDIPPHMSGQASAVQSTTRQLGSALGVAIIATYMANSLLQDAAGKLADLGLPTQMASNLESTLSKSAGSILPTLNGDPSLLAAHSRLAEVFSHSSAKAMLLSAAFVGIGFIATLILKLKSAPASEAPQ